MSGRSGTVQSIERAFAVLRQVASTPGGITDVARAVDLPVSTVARLLGTLESIGAVARADDAVTYGIGGAVDSATSLVARARPALVELVARTGETSGLSIVAGDEVVYLDHVETTHEVTLRDWTGARLPLHVVSSGLVLLAAQPPDVIASYLARPLARPTARTITQPARIQRRLVAIRRDGYVWTIGEFDDGIASVAAPVVDERGVTVAALHTHGPSYRFPRDGEADDVARHVIDAARRIGGSEREPASQPGSAGDTRR